MYYIKNKPNKLTKAQFKKELIFVLLAIALFSGCKKIFDLPTEKDYLSNNVNFSNKVLEPIIGRNTLIGGFNADNSTAPFIFEVVNARYGDGRPVTDVFQKVPTYVWTAPYTGLETSLAEIEAKRKLEQHSLFEIRSSGQFVFWGSSTNQLITPRPTDSTNFAQDTRFFDVKIKNTGGERLVRDFQIRPYRERPYEPSNDFNAFTGLPAPDPKFPLDKKLRDYIRPFLNNVIGANSNKNLVSNNDLKDAVVYIRPFTGGNGHSLRIKVLNKDSVAINPAFFNETVWEKMIHGFNVQKTTEYVQYDVAYPIPLVEVPTFYATGGTRAKVNISYSRGAFGGGRTIASFGVDFAIYKAGDWEIVFHFKTDNPKFASE
ncbi:DUF5007 domain-containing protein [Pedobacter sandarakinus]|uniref:DUF5007 domain-containing protein n=1 Tax=Pedobacter sandarakinus TaxID=353156 RepID=UPI0022486629|nr:DUF5007 domain-containing protein [Pedobacter sandarakinus]MCX2573175.1 DUF5007 domain-containing protein [Pedobacter sandarakinus]